MLNVDAEHLSERCEVGRILLVLLYPHDHSGGHQSSLDLHRRLSASSLVIALAASTYNRRSSVIGHWGVGAKADFRRLLRIWPKIMPLVTQCCRLAALGSQQYM